MGKQITNLRLQMRSCLNDFSKAHCLVRYVFTENWQGVANDIFLFCPQVSTFYDVLANLTPSGPVASNKTLTMEQVGQNYGFILYRTTIPSSISGSTANISIPGLADRGIVFVDKVCY